MKTNGITMFLFVVAVLALSSAVVMLLWNLLLPGLFGIAVINYWQAAGLLILARILFGGFGRSWMWVQHHLFGSRNPMRDKWARMTPEQREEFVNRRRRHGHGGHFGREPFERRNYDREREAND